MYRDYDTPPAWMTPKSFTAKEILFGLGAVFIAIPLLILGIAALITLIVLAIAVPPVGIALVTMGNS